MKPKRQKHARKVLAFYMTNFGHEPPYKIMVDGTFCKAALKFQINIQEQLPKYLEAEVKFVTTRCMLAECEELGPLLYGPLKILRQYKCIQCGHDPPLPAPVCMKKQANKKKKKYIIATQDKELSGLIRNLTGVPLLYISHNAMHLEDAASASLHKVEGSLQEKLLAPKFEQEKLKSLKVATFGEQVELKKRKKKGPKQPNPLSMKKKKISAMVGSTEEKEGEVKKKKKKKKTNRKQDKKNEEGSSPWKVTLLVDHAKQGHLGQSQNNLSDTIASTEKNAKQKKNTFHENNDMEINGQSVKRKHSEMDQTEGNVDTEQRSRSKRKRKRYRKQNLHEIINDS